MCKRQPTHKKHTAASQAMNKKNVFLIVVNIDLMLEKKCIESNCISQRDKLSNYLFMVYLYLLQYLTVYKNS